MRIRSATLWILLSFSLACGDDSDPSSDAAVDAGFDGGEGLDAGGETDAGQSDGSADGSSDGAADADLSGCDLGQSCCPGDLCSDDSRCVGSTCSCIAEIHGDLYRRTDGTVVHGPSSMVIQNQVADAPLTGVTQIYDGMFHGCARRTDGTVWCWGKSTNGNGSGQLGNGSIGGTTEAWSATQVMVDATTPLEDVERLNDGEAGCYLAATTCGVQTDGSVWCWGAGNNGGGGSIFTSDDQTSKPFATRIMESGATPFTGVEQVTLGRRHACALKSGQVWCWGANVAGPLGQNDQDSRQFPTLVTFPGLTQPTVEQVGAGSDVTCALADGQVYCWGATGSGQVGLGEPSANSDGCINFCRLSPARVIDTSDSDLDDAIDLNVVYLGACARRADRSLWCWGGGVGNVATALTLGGNTLINIAEHTSCGSGDVDESIRYLTEDDELYAVQNLVNHVCPGAP